MRVVMVASVSLILALGAMPVNSQETTNLTVIDLSMGQDDKVVLELGGSGWAQIRITATEALDLNFSLVHETMEDLCIFSGDGDGIYDNGHVTGFFLYDPSGGVFAGESFTWHGTPQWSVWPSQSGECGDSDPLELDAGDTVHFVIADTTGGYTATLSASFSGFEAQHIAVPLRPHDGFVRADPEPTDTTVVSDSGVDVLRERTWSAAFALQEAVITLADWDSQTGNGDAPIHLHGGAVWQTKEVLPAGTEPGTPYTTPPGLEASSVGQGGESGGRGTISMHWTEPGAFDLIYARADVSATFATDREVGAYFIAFPLYP